MNKDLLLTAVLLLPLGATSSDAASGNQGATFLNIPVGAGPAALGSAYTPLATDAYAPVWNPAGLAFVDSPELATQYLSYLESINSEYVGFAYPLRDGKGLGVSAQYLGSGDIVGTQVGGAPTGSYSSYYGAYSLAYGQTLTDDWSLGLTGKWINASIDNVTANAYAVDFGSLYRFRPDLTFGATLQNLGTKLNFLSEGDSLPLAFHLAAAYTPSPRWLGTVEGVYPQSGPASARFGGQWRPTETLALRVGYRTDNLDQLSAIAGFSVGMGITLWKQELAYAWVPYGDLGDTQYISLVIRFGAFEKNGTKGTVIKTETSEPTLPELPPAAPPAPAQAPAAHHWEPTWMPPR